MKTFQFPSKSTLGMVYTTILNDNNVLTCNCKGFTMRDKRECTHTKQVAAQEGIVSATVFPPPAQQTSLFADPEGFIEPMLASALKEGKSIRDYSNSEWRLEEKYDGHRLIVRVALNEVVAWSRAGNVRRLAPHVVRELNRLALGTYDGELIIPGGTSTDVTALEKLDTSMFMIFDLINIDNAGSCVSSREYSYEYRRNLLELATSKLNWDSPAVRLAQQYEPSELTLEHIWQRGGEGAVVKHRASQYEPGKRSREWVKFKKLGAATLTILGFEEGRLGPHAMIRLRDDAGIEITVKSLNDEWRAMFAVNHERFIGKKLVISYQEKTRDGKYRHPMADHILED